MKITARKIGIKKRNLQKRAGNRKFEKISSCLTDNKKPGFLHKPDYERMEWFNTILNQLWPFVNAFVKRLIRDQIEPELRKQIPKLNIEFTAFELGKQQPRLTAVKAYPSKGTC